MTRLTNAFSKKMENHAHAMVLHFLYYNFVRIHKTLKTSLAMAASVTDRLWELRTWLACWRRGRQQVADRSDPGCVVGGIGCLIAIPVLLFWYGAAILVFKYAFGVELPNPINHLPPEWQEHIPRSAP